MVVRQLGDFDFRRKVNPEPKGGSINRRHATVYEDE